MAYRAVSGLVLALLLLAAPGCGLVLDYDPPTDGGLDAQRPDGGRPDVGVRDSGPQPECVTDVDCDDDDACNGLERCEDGSCVDGTAIVCVDENVCDGTDTCDPATGMCRTNTGLACPDDGNACNGVEECDPRVGCTRTPAIDCDDGIACTSEVCDPSTGHCVRSGDDRLCTAAPGGRCLEDGCSYPTCDAATCVTENPCRPAMCVGGVCQRTDMICPGTMECCGGDCHPVGCDDGNDCTDDSCNRTTGCQNIPRARGCDDGDPCTVGDRCVLAGGAVSCVPTGPRACLPPDQCHAGICHSDTGDCELVPLSGVPCVDANACTSGDTCVSGACTPGIPVVCFASNPCVDTSCDPFRGCQLVPKPDGTVCEGPDTVIGVCIAGACGTNPCPLGGVECDGDSATVCECPTLCAISSMGGFCVDPRDCRAAGCGFGEDCCADGPSAGSCYGSGCMACCPAAT